MKTDSTILLNHVIIINTANDYVNPLQNEFIRNVEIHILKSISLNTYNTIYTYAYHSLIENFC